MDRYINYINILKEELDKYERMPDVCGKILTIEVKILTGRCDYGSNKK